MRIERSRADVRAEAMLLLDASALTSTNLGEFDTQAGANSPASIQAWRSQVPPVVVASARTTTDIRRFRRALRDVETAVEAPGSELPEVGEPRFETVEGNLFEMVTPSAEPLEPQQATAGREAVEARSGKAQPAMQAPGPLPAQAAEPTTESQNLVNSQALEAKTKLQRARIKIEASPVSGSLPFPEGLQVSQWQQRSTFEKIAFQKSGISDNLREIEKLFAEVSLGDDVVTELQQGGGSEDNFSGIGAYKNLVQRYDRLLNAIDAAAAAVRTTQAQRSRFLTSDAHKKISTLSKDLAGLRNTLTDRRALIEGEAGKVMIERSFALSKARRFFDTMAPIISTSFAKAQSLTKGCKTLADLEVNFADNNAFRSICNFNKALLTLQKDLPDVAEVVGTSNGLKMLERKPLFVDAAAAPWIGHLRDVASKSNPDYHQVYEKIENEYQKRIYEIDIDIKGKYGPEWEKSEKASAQRSRSISECWSQRTTALKNAAQGWSLDNFPAVTKQMDRLSQDLSEYQAILVSIYAGLRAFR